MRKKVNCMTAERQHRQAQWRISMQRRCLLVALPRERELARARIRDAARVARVPVAKVKPQPLHAHRHAQMGRLVCGQILMSTTQDILNINMLMMQGMQ
jgi:hypothetical protein